jgi:hypothetical protein
VNLQPQGAVEADVNDAVASRKNMKRGLGGEGRCHRGVREEEECQEQCGE